MQNIIIDKPYRFVPPCRGWFWPTVLRMYARRLLDRHHGIVAVTCHGADRLAGSIAAGHGILLAPNHCRESDPLVLGALSCAVHQHFYLMASWHLFMQKRLTAFLLNRAGAFSIYREGMDRAAINAATEILEKAERPLVIFPEGVVSRTNDRLNALMDGTALIARTAARKRSRLSPAGKVVVHPIAIRYRFGGDINAALQPVLDEIERRLSWRPQNNLPLVDRVSKIGLGLLCLQEIGYFGQAQAGSIAHRLERLIDQILCPLESRWLEGQKEGTVVARVKRLRGAILPVLVKGDIVEAERQARWQQLADVYLAQQLANYPPDYIHSNPTPERLMETVERFEEDLTDHARPHRPMEASIRVGEAIEVNPAREQRGEADPLMHKIEEGLRGMLGIDTAGPEPGQMH